MNYTVSFLKSKRLIGSILFIAFLLLLLPGKSNAQCTGEYKIVTTYNSDGDKIRTDNSIPRILVVSTNFMGIRQASVTNYNPIMNMYNTAEMYFKYCGYNNGWYIYRCDVFMMGSSFLYLHEDGDCVRLKYSYMDGKYNEYVPYKSGEDVDRGPTY